jgi:hypothetical protein
MYLHCIGFVLHFLMMMMMMVMVMMENLEHLQRTAAILVTGNKVNDAPVHFA